MSLWKHLFLGLCLIGGASEGVTAGQLSAECCGSGVNCDHSCFACQPSCDHSCFLSRKCACLKHCLQTHFLDSTCDMYQHYPYFPENHGYYYFRPYNWEHYSQDTPRLLGLGYAAPYAEDGFRELKPTTVVAQPVIHTRRSALPNLEDLLRK